MKPVITLLLICWYQIATSGGLGTVNILPAAPRAGDNIVVEVHSSCPYDHLAMNDQGLTHLFEYEAADHIMLTSLHEPLGCVGVPTPTPPLSFVLGKLAVGSYTLEAFTATNDLSLPTNNRTLIASISFQVGPAPQPVNSLSKTALLLFMLTVLYASRRWFHKPSDHTG